jgi:hypothetical protein
MAGLQFCRRSINCQPTPTLSDLLSKSLETAVVEENGSRDVDPGPGSGDGRKIDWLSFSAEASAAS